MGAKIKNRLYVPTKHYKMLKSKRAREATQIAMINWVYGKITTREAIAKIRDCNNNARMFDSEDEFVIWMYSLGYDREDGKINDLLNQHVYTVYLNSLDGDFRK